MRYISKDHPNAKSQIDDSGISIEYGWPYGPPQTRSHIDRLIAANNVLTRISKHYGFGAESHDPLTYFNIKPPAVTYSCPGWNDITEHLFSNCEPLELALDTTELLSVPTLFRWEPFPGFGIVKCIAIGWSLPMGGSNFVSWLSPIGEPDEDDMETLDNLMSDQAVQEALYEYCGGCRDLEIETFRLWLVHRFETEGFDG
ncbi:hypothetical protein BPOR_0593g00070 [Botrytis porri]|uniref:Uncharacterized protein n=1 Tax=Botrytis porri TaxID=87229 RepID=A0A4Z1KEM7_9HELO|nr:hypothetical protein BPOR_0593g00070 [Botrytis porri]